MEEFRLGDELSGSYDILMLRFFAPWWRAGGDNEGVAVLEHDGNQ